MYNLKSIFHAIMGYMGLLDNRFPFYVVLGHYIVYIQHYDLFKSFVVYLHPSTTISVHFFTQLCLFILSTCQTHLCMHFLMPQAISQLIIRLSILRYYTSTVASSCHFSPALPTLLLLLPRYD